MKIILRLIVCLITAWILQGCSLESSTSPITPIPPAPEPEWLTVLYPKPGTTISLADYNSSVRDTHSGSLPLLDIPASICIEVWGGYLIEAGDFWESSDIISRTTLLVDGSKRSPEGPVLDGIVLGTLTDESGKEIANVGGPYGFCFSALLTVGYHKAEISFKKSSGVTLSYAWTFEIVDGSPPTATPLPTPSVVDLEGHLPTYLRDVFPKPDQIVSLNNYVQTMATDKEIWGDYSGIDSPQPYVCFAFRVDEIQNLGSLPHNHRDWVDHIFISVDDILLEDWLYPNRSFWEAGSSLVQAHCINVDLGVGTHIATVYVSPFDNDLVIYSWQFTIEP